MTSSETPQSLPENMPLHGFIMPPDDVVYVTGIPDAGIIKFTGYDGQPAAEPITGMKRSRLNFLVTQLADVYTVLGPGGHSVLSVEDAVADLHPEWQSDITIDTVRAMARRLPDVVAYAPQPKCDDEIIRLGWLAVTMRQSTAEERELHRAERQAAIDKGLAEARAYVEAAEAEKVDLTVHDHAIVATTTKAFYLALDTPEAIVAARLIGRLSEQPAVFPTLALPLLTKHTWKAMSIAERRLFCVTDKEIYGQSDPVRQYVLDALTTLTNAIGITRRGLVEEQYIITDPEVTIAYQIEPVAPEMQGNAVPLFPPGVERDTIRADYAEATTEELAAAGRLIARSRERHVSQAEAIQLMNDVMSARIKRVLRSLMPKQNSDERLNEVLNGVHELLHASLGAAYWTARRNRMIAGFKSTGGRQNRAKHRAGNLPITTIAPGSDTVGVTTRWTVGHLK